MLTWLWLYAPVLLGAEINAETELVVGVRRSIQSESRRRTYGERKGERG